MLELHLVVIQELDSPYVAEFAKMIQDLHHIHKHSNPFTISETFVPVLSEHLVL